MEIRPARDWDKSGRRFGSTEKSRRELGFVAEISVVEGIQRTVQWTKDNRDLIIQNINKHNDKMKEIERA